MPPRRRKPPKATKPRGSRVTARDRKVVELRSAGATLEAIAAELRFRDAGGVHLAYERALDRDLPPPPAEQRRLALEQLRDREDRLWSKADAGSIAAIDELAQIHLDRIRLNAAGPLLEQVRRELGPIEAKTVEECEALARNAPALAAAAIALARTVDETPADQASAQASAARELRMSMSNLRGLAGLQAPESATSDEEQAEKQKGPGTGKSPDGKGGTVVDASVLEKLRQQGDRG